MGGFIWNLLWFLVALGVLITFHEFGHYWIAKRCGVKVLRFSIGFGKPLFSRTDKSGTEFVVAGIPLGGYVRMLDGRVDEVSDSERHLAFDTKPVWQRIAIIAAGPIANFLLAIVAFWWFFSLGITSIKPVVGSVKTDSIAAVAGISARDKIVSINGHETLDWSAVELNLIDAIGHDSVRIHVLNLDSNTTREYRLDTTQWRFDPEKQSSVDSLGIVPFRPPMPAEIAKVTPDSAASKADLRVGDVVIAVDGQAIDSWQGLVERIQDNRGSAMALGVRRGEQNLVIDVTPQYVPEREHRVLGVMPKSPQWPDDALIKLEFDFVEAAGRGVESTLRYISISFSSIVKLIVGDLSVKNLSGPFSIAQGAGDTASYGLAYFLRFLAIISINLGVINLLPLPVLDGGHLFFYLIELIRRKPVSERTQEIGFRIGAFVLFFVMAIALTNDIMRL